MDSWFGLFVFFLLLVFCVTLVLSSLFAHSCYLSCIFERLYQIIGQLVVLCTQVDLFRDTLIYAGLLLSAVVFSGFYFALCFSCVFLHSSCFHVLLLSPALQQPRGSCPAPSVFPSLSAPSLPLCCVTCSLSDYFSSCFILKCFLLVFCYLYFLCFPTFVD